MNEAILTAVHVSRQCVPFWQNTLQEYGYTSHFVGTPKIPNCLLFRNSSHFQHLQIFKDFCRHTLWGLHLRETSSLSSTSPASKWVSWDAQTLDFFSLSSPCCVQIYISDCLLLAGASHQRLLLFSSFFNWVFPLIVFALKNKSLLISNSTYIWIKIWNHSIFDCCKDLESVALFSHNRYVLSFVLRLSNSKHHSSWYFKSVSGKWSKCYPPADTISPY